VSKKKSPHTAKVAGPKRPAPIALEARMTIVHAADLHRALLARLTQGEAVVVDGSRVEEIDTSVLQLLISLWRTASQRGIACAWTGSSSALREAADLLGVADMLQLADGAA
jgi:phospholipid transport system transporter-binding protein